MCVLLQPSKVCHRSKMTHLGILVLMCACEHALV